VASIPGTIADEDMAEATCDNCHDALRRDESMIKLLFKPFSVVGGILAGLIGRKALEGIWAALARREVPDPSHRETAWSALIPALLLEGAIFRAVRGAVDHGPAAGSAGSPSAGRAISARSATEPGRRESPAGTRIAPAGWAMRRT
jgi:hypothetical protein